MEEDQVVIYRMGGLDLREIKKIVGKVEVRSHSSVPIPQHRAYSKVIMHRENHFWWVIWKN